MAYSKADIAAAEAQLDTYGAAADTALAKQDPDQGIALEQKEKKTFKQAMSNLGESIKQDPAGTIGAAVGEARQPLVDYAEMQRERQAQGVPTAEELVGEPINLADVYL